MKAAVYKKYGPPSVIQVMELEKPEPTENELLVRVHATTVNRTDCAILRAKPFMMRFFMGLFSPKKPIPGTDFAGEVVALGKHVSAYKVGDKVFGFNDLGLSSQAQYLVISEDESLSSMPEGLSYAKAAASIEGAHYAYNMINKVDLKAGQKVLVNGATGAIGSAAVQLLKSMDAQVTAVGNTQNIERVRSLGADVVIDYEKEDFTQRSDSYAFIFDTVGKSSFSRCKPLLEEGGAYISSELGRMSENLFYALFTPIFGKKKVVFPIPTDRDASISLIKKLIEDGKFSPLMDTNYPLDDIVNAYKYVESGQKTGNVTLSMVDE